MNKMKEYAAMRKAQLKEQIAQMEHPPSLLILQVGEVEASTRYNQEEESMITDFSQYEDKKRVSLIINKVGPHPDADEENGADLDDDIIVYPQAVVYRIGETWLWKVL